MRYGTVCSGIEAPSVAWGPLGWEPQWFSEIEPFPKAALAHHYPNIPDLGDMTKVDWKNAPPIDLLIGGTPCQSFSVAGLRKGLDDPRGNLALEFLRIVDIKRPRWFIWENVPGVLSSNGGRDFGSFLGALGKLGYGFAYRILDAQNFGVPQRRRRVFVVGHIGNWAYPAAVLFNAESLRGGVTPGRAKGEIAPTIPSRSTAGGGLGTDFDCDGGLIHCSPVSPTVTSSGPPFSRTGNSRVEADALVVMSSGQANCNRDGTPIVFHPRQTPVSGSVAMPCETNGPMAVRRLTPVECERLQGFPDNYTRIGWNDRYECLLCGEEFKDKQASGVGGLAPAKCVKCGEGKEIDFNTPMGHRYKALGNSMAVPVIRWIGERIEAVEAVS